VLLIPTSALAYRPFVSTDEAVADPGEVEIELGYFNLERTARENTFITPSVVLNYGFVKNWEAVGEFHVESSPELEITDPGLSLKGVLKEGVLQEKEGVSVAIEAGLLLPSTLPHEHGVGVEAIAIVSGKAGPVTAHVTTHSSTRPAVFLRFVSSTVWRPRSSLRSPRLLLPTSRKVAVVRGLGGLRRRTISGPPRDPCLEGYCSFIRRATLRRT
jgi:hypothetical protein